MTRILLLALVTAACSGKEDPSDLRAEVADLRAEQRAMRQEIRELRELLPKPAASDADPGPPAGEPGQETAPEPPGGAAAPATPPAAPAAKAGKTPAQGSVNIQVESNPAGAAVFVADKKVGITPVVIKTPVGTSEISMRLEKSGYRPRLMTLRPDEDTKISVQLAKKGE